MQSTAKRNIKSGDRYDHLFPKPEGEDVMVNKNATVEDTIKFIPQVVNDTLDDTKGIAKILKGKNVYDTCKNIWDFVYTHVPYKKDEDGKEQVRRPARVWHDRKKENTNGEAGCDCDCYTTFISSILSNLGLPHILRICKYWYTDGRYTHIYPVLPTENGKYITIDCVVNKFNHEEPFTEKFDTPMELHYLNGIYESDFSNENNNEASMMSGDGFGKLGKKGFFNKAGKILKKGLNITNKANPATVLLRNGLLASMKLNVFKVAEKLKYAYLDEGQAKNLGLNMSRYAQTKKVKDKIENIFYGAGGDPKNLKKAILSGKGNPHHEVSGLDENFDQSSSLEKILGEEMYQSETAPDGVQGLGIIATTAALASASGIIAAIAGILKSIGDIKGKPSAADNASNTDADTNKQLDNLTTTNPGDGSNSTTSKDIAPTTNTTPTDDTSNNTSDQPDTNDNSKPGVWEKNKKWIVPTGIGVGLLGLIYAAVQHSKKHEPQKQMSGLEGNHSHGIYHKRKRKHFVNAVKII